MSRCSNNLTAHCLALPLLVAGAVLAGPVTTVPWNGYTGAVSFTYDDARSGQIPNLLPQLDNLGFKATFFLTYGAGGDLSTNKSKWIAAGKNGHELANHTYDHQNATDGDAQIAKMAADIRGMDASFDAVTFAYPNCSVGGTSTVGAESFMGRSCGSTRYSWSASQPGDWMNIQGLIVTSGASASAVSAVNSAKSENSWATIIIHDVTASPDQYSLTPANNKTILDAASSAKVWVAPYGTVGAYYRAHYTMDAVTATKSGTGWTMSWTSPHAKMPKSVKLRVKLAAATFGTDFVVKQGDNTIAPQTDGSYEIEFMKLAMSVAPKSVGVQSRAANALPEIDARMAESGIVLSGLDHEMDAALVDVRGTTVFQGTTSRLIPLAQAEHKGILFLTLTDRATGIQVHKLVNTTR